MVPVEYLSLGILLPAGGPVNPACAAMALLYAFANILTAVVSDVKVCFNLW